MKTSENMRENLENLLLRVKFNFNPLICILQDRIFIINISSILLYSNTSNTTLGKKTCHYLKMEKMFTYISDMKTLVYICLNVCCHIFCFLVLFCFVVRIMDCLVDVRFGCIYWE